MLNFNFIALENLRALLIARLSRGLDSDLFHQNFRFAVGKFSVFTFLHSFVFPFAIINSEKLWRQFNHLRAAREKETN